MIYIYKITNKTNKKIYVGKGTMSSKVNRWKKHLSIARGGKEKYPKAFYAIHAAIKKYGENNFTFETIDYANSNKEGAELEIYWIDKLQSNSKLGYNLTKGGDGCLGKIHTLQSKKKMSFAQKGEKSWRAKLNDKIVNDIKILLRDKIMTQKEISNMLNVHISTICNINKGKTWNWIKVPGFEKSLNKTNIRHTKESKIALQLNNKKRVVSPEEVLEIRKVFSENKLSRKEISDKFRININIIYQIISRKTWKNL